MEKSILLIGNDIRSIEDIKHNLSILGYGNCLISEVGNISEALIDINEKDITPNLIILDVNGYANLRETNLLKRIISLSKKDKKVDTLLVTGEENIYTLKMNIEAIVDEKINLFPKLPVSSDFSRSLDTILSSKRLNEGRIGIIGAGGRIGGSLLTNLAQQGKELGIEEVRAYCRDGEEDKINGAIQLADPGSKVTMNIDKDLEVLAKNSGIIVVAIAHSEKGRITRTSELLSEYFLDMKLIQDKIGKTEATLLVETNYVNSHCLILDIYSQNKNQLILGHTRVDRERAIKIVEDHLKNEPGWKNYLMDLKVDLDIWGPHGEGVLPTKIRVNKAPPLFKNQELIDRLGLTNELTFEELSQRIVKYGQDTFVKTGQGDLSNYYAGEIIKTIYNVMNDKKETVTLNVNLNQRICDSEIYPSKGPVYISAPVLFSEGTPEIDVRYLRYIPEKQRLNLVVTINKERKAIFDRLEKISGLECARDKLREWIN